MFIGYHLLVIKNRIWKQFTIYLESFYFNYLKLVIVFEQICFIMTAVTMVVRLDVFSVVYGILLGFFLLLGRRKCRWLWPGYIILLAILIVIQYLSCVGAPIGLCWRESFLCGQFNPTRL